jgi:hypothetical protein
MTQKYQFSTQIHKNKIIFYYIPYPMSSSKNSDSGDVLLDSAVIKSNFVEPTDTLRVPSTTIPVEIRGTVNIMCCPCPTCQEKRCDNCDEQPGNCEPKPDPDCCEPCKQADSESPKNCFSCFTKCLPNVFPRKIPPAELARRKAQET